MHRLALMHRLDRRTRATAHTAVGICRDRGAAVGEEQARATVKEIRPGSMPGAAYRPPAPTVRYAMCATERAA